MARWVPREEMTPDYVRRYDEAVKTLPDPTEPLKIAQRRQEQEAEEMAARAAADQELAQFDDLVKAVPPPGGATVDQLAAYDEAVATGSQMLAQPMQSPDAQDRASLSAPASVSSPAVPTLPESPTAVPADESPAPEPPPASAFVAPVAKMLGVDSAAGGAASPGGITAPRARGPDEMPIMRGLTSAYEAAKPAVQSALDSPIGRAVTGMVTPGGTLQQLGVSPETMADVGGQALKTGAAYVRQPQQSIAQGVRALGETTGLTEPTPGKPTGAEGLTASLTDPDLAFGMRQGEQPYDPVEYEQILAEAGVAEGPMRQAAGRVLDQLVDPVNFTPIGVESKATRLAKMAWDAAKATGDDALIAAAKATFQTAFRKRLISEGIAGGVGGGVGQTAVEQGAKALGADEDTQAVAGVAGALIGGGIGATKGADVLDAAAPRVAAGARTLSSVIEGAGLTPGLSIQPVGREPSPLMQQLARGENVPNSEVLRRIDEIDFITAEDAAKALTEATDNAVPRYLNGVQDFMIAQREKVKQGLLTPRDVAKAYAMTLGSIGSAEINRETAETAFGRMGDEFVQPNKKGIPSVRPEEAVAHWMFSGEGQRALDEIEQGVVDEGAWHDLLARRRGYGRSGLEVFREKFRQGGVKGSGINIPVSNLFSQPQPGTYNLRNIGEFTDAINATRGDPALMNEVVTKAYGISSGKVGFVKSLLGLGDTPTFDAVELNFWLTGKGDISRLKTVQADAIRTIKGNSGEIGKRRKAGEVIDEDEILGGYLSDPAISEALRNKLMGRIDELRAMGLGSDIDPDLAAHVMHHWIWDKAKGVQTTHEGLMKAQTLAAGAPGGLAGVETDEEGNLTGEFDPVKGALGVAAGTVGMKLANRAGPAARSRPLTENAARLMETYARVGPDRAAKLRTQAVDLGAQRFGPLAKTPGGRAFVERTLDAIERMLPESKMVVTNISPQQLINIRQSGSLLSKFDALDDPEAIAQSTRRVVGGKRFETEAAKAYPTSPEDFAARERRADEMALGGTDVSRVYARVTSGEPLPDEGRGLVYIVWDDDTPRVTSLHHHFAHTSPDYPLHDDMLPAYKEALWRQPVTGAVDAGGGRSIIDTPYLVGPEQENLLRAASLLMSAPKEALDALQRGGVTSPDEMAAAIMRGATRQDQPLTALAKKSGIPKDEAKAEYGLAGSRNQNRSESLIVEPDLAHVKAIYVTGDADWIDTPYDGLKRNPSPAEAASLLKQKIAEMTGKDVPIVRKTLEVGGDKIIPSELSPGRAAVRDSYMRSGLKDIGGFNPAGAAQGGMAGALAGEAAGDDEGSPFSAERVGLTGLAMLAGSIRPPPGFKRTPARQRILNSYTGKAAGALVHRDVPGGLAQAITRAATDRDVDLVNFRKAVGRELGRDLQPEEMADLYRRKNPVKQSEVFVEERMRPAIQSVGEDRPFLEEYLTHWDNIDVARSIGKRVERETIEGGIREPYSVSDLKRARARLQAHQNFTKDAAKIAEAQADVDRLEKLSTKEVQQRQTRLAIRAKAKGAAAREERVFSDDLRVADSYEGLKNLEAELGPERFAKVEAAAQRMHAMVDDLVEMKVEAGIFSRDLADQLRKDYPNYVPTKILDYMMESGKEGLAQGHKIGLTDRGLRELSIKGTKKERETPLASLVRYAYDTHTAVQRNDTFNAFKKLADLRGQQNYASVIVPITPGTGPQFKGGQWEKVTGYVDGTAQHYAVAKELAPIVRGDVGVQAPAPLKVLMAIFRAAATSRNPLFLASNAALDAASFSIRESVRSGGPQHLPAIWRDLASAYWDELVALAKGEMSEGTKAFYRAGGGQSGAWTGSTLDAKKSVETLGRGRGLTGYLHEVDDAKGVARLLKDIALMEPVAKIGEHIEAAPRVAAYKRSLKRNAGNELQAMIDGRTITMDFAQGGNWAKLINEIVPFFNVGMQGLATVPRIVREGKEMTGSHKSFAGTVAATLVLPMIAAETWNRADPQRSDDYDDVPDYVKDQGIVIMWPVEAPVDNEGNRRPQYTLFRLREFAPAAIMGREVFNRVTGQGDPRKIRDLVSSSWNAVSPVSADNPAEFFNSFNPLLFSTATQVATDKDFFRGGSIATEDRDRKASTLSKGISAGLNATGLVETRPSQVEFVGGDVGGGLYRSYGAASTLAERAATGQPLNESGTVEDAPVVGGVARRFGGSSIGGNLRRLQDETEEGPLNQAAKEAGSTYRQSPARGEIDGVRLTRVEQANYQRAINAYVQDDLADLIGSTEWYDATPDEKEQMLASVVRRAQQRARNDVVSDVPDWDVRQLQSTVNGMGG